MKCSSHQPAIARTATLAALVSLALAGCAITPTPLSSEDNRRQAEQLLARYAKDQEPVSGPIDLYEAMARALKYNLDYRVEVANRQLRARNLDLSRMDMLPKLVASLNYGNRSNDSGGTSRSLLTGRQSLEPSTSTERSVTDAGVNLSWDVLDFGLSYVRAQQAADDVLIAEENKRRVANRTIEDVRTAWWRAASAQRLTRDFERLQASLRTALDESRDVESRKLTAPLASLTYQRELHSISRELLSLKRELSVAKQQLAALMNLPMETPYELAVPTEEPTLPALRLDAREMLQMALENRSELREIAYRLRSNSKEGTAALLRSLPSLKAFLGFNWSSNDLLYNNDWVAVGAQASWNLLNVFRLPYDQARARAEGELLDQRGLALTTAVATQVHVGRARYEFYQAELESARNLRDIQDRIYEQIRAGFEAGKMSRQTQVREEMNQLVSRVRYDVAVADVQSAYANVYAAMGIDPWPADASSNDTVASLAGKLRSLWVQRERSSSGSRAG